VAGTAGLLFLRTWHPEQTVLPPCPTWRFLGIYCPGCGSTRAAHQLVNGRLLLALRYNPLWLLLGVPATAWLAWQIAQVAWRGRAGWRLPLNAAAAWTIAAVVILFGLLRNLPLAALDWLRPPG
jgi:hypothetical protein